jgi:carboxyl-terminal processing protease
VWLGLAVGLILGLTISAVPARSGSSDVEKLVDEFVKPLAWLVLQVENYYVEPVDRHDLLVGAYQGILGTLDRYSVYWPPEMVKEFEADLEGEFGGLGIQISFDAVKKVIRVEQPIAGTPAFRQGVLPGDLIIKVKEDATGQEVKTEEFKTVHDAVKVLRGEVGTKVTITVIHEDDGKKEDITVTREVITVPGVRAVDIVDAKDQIGYIYIPYFSKPMVKDLRAAMDDLQDKGARGVVLDLRLNPGGLLKAAEDCADLFLKGGQIVRVKGRTGPEEVHTARKTAPFDEVPLVVLVDRFSASGAEIVAAALRDNGRAALVGEATFGKASVQTLIDNPQDGSAVKLTIARYYTPNGELIEGKGVQPDVIVELSDDDTRQLARQLSRKTEYPPPLPGARPRTSEEAEKPTEQQPEKPFEDVQLAKAVEVMREMLSGRTPAQIAAAHKAPSEPKAEPAAAAN